MPDFNCFSAMSIIRDCSFNTMKLLSFRRGTSSLKDSTSIPTTKSEPSGSGPEHMLQSASLTTMEPETPMRTTVWYTVEAGPSVCPSSRQYSILRSRTEDIWPSPPHLSMSSLRNVITILSKASQSMPSRHRSIHRRPSGAFCRKTGMALPLGAAQGMTRFFIGRPFRSCGSRPKRKTGARREKGPFPCRLRKGRSSAD